MKNYINKSKNFKAYLVVAIYVIFFLYTITQSVFFAKNPATTAPDEIAHISYVTYLYDTQKIIPDFKDMHMLNNSPIKWSTDCYIYRRELVNYLCHPPLYYHLMRLSGSISPADTKDFFFIDFLRLRYFSIFIMSLGLLTLLYIGFSRIPKDALSCHFLYSAIVTSIPMLAYEGGAVTNDNLVLLTVGLGLLGYLRFNEKKRNTLTYILIALGITCSLLTKMTAAILLVLIGGLLLISTMLREKSLNCVLNKGFFVSLPIYFIALFYFAVMLKSYGTIQPSLELICTEKYFKSTYFYTAFANRTSMTPSQYLSYYFTNFFLSWCSCYGSNFFYKETVFTKAALVSELLWIIPILTIILFIIKKNTDKLFFYLSCYVGLIITFLMQLKSAYGSFLSRGYMGGYQSRYYLPMVVVFALSACELYLSTNKNTRVISVIANALCVLYGIALVYASFPFFLIHFT